MVLANLMKACTYDINTNEYVNIDWDIISIESFNDDQIIDAVIKTNLVTTTMNRLIIKHQASKLLQALADSPGLH